MATLIAANVIPLRQSKRKRAQVTYYESESDSDIDSAYMSATDDESSMSKAKPKKRSRGEKPQKPFPFLSLPPELRNRIYEFALVDQNILVLQECWRNHRRCAKRSLSTVQHITQRSREQSQVSHDKDNTPSELYTLSPNILATCRQIHTEAAQILYTQPLHFVNTMSLHHFLAPLSAPTSGLLRTLILHSYPVHGRGIHKAMSTSAMTLLRDCTGLRTLRIKNGLHSHFHWTPGNGESMGQRLAKQLYRDASVWLDRIGAAKALEILDLEDEFCVRWDLYSHERSAQEKDRLGRAREAYEKELGLLVGNRGTVKLRAVKRRRRQGDDMV